MRLNLTILADYLERPVFSKRISNPRKRLLERVELWREGRQIRDDTVYICQNSVPLSSEGQLICLGFKPTTGSDYISIDSGGLAPHVIMEQVFDIFAFFNEWECDLIRAYVNKHCLIEYANIGARVFENTFCIIDANCLQLCHKHIPENGVFVDYYAKADYTYPKAISISTDSDPELRVALTKKQPYEWFSACVEDAILTPTLSYNIHSGDARIGTIVLDATNREFRASDHILIEFFGEHVKEAILRWDILPFGYSEAFDTMVSNLIKGSPFPAGADEVLQQRGWSVHDRYRCACISIDVGQATSVLSSEAILFFLGSFDETYIRKYPDGEIVAIFNKTKSQKSGVKISEALKNFALSQNCKIGLSSTFTNFANVHDYVYQAKEALKIVLARPMSFGTFDSLALDILLEKITSSSDFAIDKYCTDKVKSLLENSGETNTLLITLETYLGCNCNASLAYDKLHLSKTSFYYRLSRIEGVSGLDLSDHETRLYLSIILKLIRLSSRNNRLPSM